MNKNIYKGIAFSAFIAVFAYFLGKKFPVVGGPVFGILLGIILNNFKRPESLEAGIKFTSKKILQYAVILLGFGLNLREVIVVGKSSLLIILSTISTALIISYLAAKFLKIDSKIATLIGVGSSICGGSAMMTQL